MKKINSLKMVIVIAAIFTCASCNKNADKNIPQPPQQNTVSNVMMSENGANPDEVAVTTQNVGNTGLSTERKDKDGINHFLYTETNEAGNNRILAYEINLNGSLHLDRATASGGAGMGMGLGSQGALVLDKEHAWLFAVNAGSNSVSSFKVHNDGSLTLAHTEESGGTTPNSVSVYGNLLYVLNTGSDNIHGFWIGEEGELTSIKGSTQSLSAKNAVAPQISFTPNADWVVVTEKATNVVSTFKVKNDGSVSHGIFTASVGQTPFGFGFSRDRFMIVSNAAGGATGVGSATSYITGNNGIPKDINGAIPNFQSAPCWVAITKYGRFAYTTNTASNNISSYYVAPWGGLYLVQSEAAKTDIAPIDIVVAANNYYVYELNSKSNTIGAYHRMLFGGLEFIGSVSGVPIPATGLAIY